MQLSLESPVRALHELSEVVHDACYRIRTAGTVYPAQAGVHNPDAMEYAASPYRVLRRLFRYLPAKSYEGSFLDYGSGRGRVLVMAAARPFRRVIGVELSQQLAAEAWRNLREARVRRCATVEILQTDAAQFQVPDDVSTLYFYNPFRTDTMRSVIERVAESLERCSREVWLLACNPGVVEAEARGRLPLSLVASGRTIYPDVRWVMYRIHHTFS
jgi:16S rRNA G966 N2-methylase RsmD